MSNFTTHGHAYVPIPQSIRQTLKPIRVHAIKLYPAAKSINCNPIMATNLRVGKTNMTVIIIVTSLWCKSERDLLQIILSA